MRGGFFTPACEGGHPPSRAGNRTFTPRNSPRIPDLQFVQISATTICYFTPLFLVFGGPTPLECPDSRPVPVQTALEVEQTRPVRVLCSVWAKNQNVLGLPPQTWRHSRFCHCRDRRVAPCWAVCAHEGANERLRAEPGSSARALWAHLLRRVSGEASHPVRSCWRCSGSACHARWASSRMRSRRRHEPFLCSLLVSSGRLERASRGSLVGLQL